MLCFPLYGIIRTSTNNSPVHLILEETALDLLTQYALIASRYIIVLLSLAIIVRCIRSMLSGAYEDECWGFITFGDEEIPILHWENIIGRSFAFTGPLLEAAKKYFPEQLKDVTHEDFWKAVNRAEAGPIRIAADELTYALHILVRYEIEKQMIAGTLAVKDAPAEWNRLYEEYLGVTPENDAKGILQDSHWAGTSIGYFPTYALGSAYGAQQRSVPPGRTSAHYHR